jgi:hypothetical protein
MSVIELKEKIAGLVEKSQNEQLLRAVYDTLENADKETETKETYDLLRHLNTVITKNDGLLKRLAQ